MHDAPQSRTAVFISYSHADKRHLDQLLLHLEPLKRDRKIEVWADTMLRAGDDWREEIRRALASAQVAIVLVSAAFRASRFIAENELPPLLAAAKKEGVLIVPVVVGACDFHDSELAGVQAVNEPSKPLSAVSKQRRDEVWVKVVQRVKEALPAKPSRQHREDKSSVVSAAPGLHSKLELRAEEPVSPLQVFVSHSHQDDTFCRDIVSALRGAGADVWYDQHNLGAGQLMDVIQRELDRRPIFVLVLSKHAFASKWVKRETGWAYELYDRNPSRLILPVTAAPIERSDFSGANGWLFLSDFRRIEAPGLRPYPIEEACGRLLHALALTAPGEAVTVPTPQPRESVDDLLAQGKALIAQKKYAEAIPFLERATRHAPRRFAAWASLGFVYGEIGRYGDGLAACDRALAIDDTQAWVWSNKGNALNYLNHYDEALGAFERALALDPNNTFAWNNMGNALSGLGRPDEALVAYERALALDPNYTFAWYGKGSKLLALRRPNEALAAFDRALALDPQYVKAWNGKGNALNVLWRPGEALNALDRALELDSTLVAVWGNKGNALASLKRHEEALAAYDRALALAPNFTFVWVNKAIALREAGRTAEADAAEQRARELGWKD